MCERRVCEREVCEGYEMSGEREASVEDEVYFKMLLVQACVLLIEPHVVLCQRIQLCLLTRLIVERNNMYFNLLTCLTAKTRKTRIAVATTRATAHIRTT